MSARWMRTRLRREDALAATAVSLAVGAGVAVVAFYAMRLLLAREPLADQERLESPPRPREGQVDGPR